MKQLNLNQLRTNISNWASDLGFAEVGFSDTDLKADGEKLRSWLAKGLHGEMEYMTRHGDMRWNPAKLKSGARSIISFRINYLEKNPAPKDTIRTENKGSISKYAQGRDYHKTIRTKLKKLEKKIRLFCEENNHNNFESRLVTDSAPILEKAVAQKAGLGWIGKNTLLINKEAGSWFFLAEILTNLPLAKNNLPEKNLCGDCQACLKICPTKAIIEPYVLDAKKCISYLTIENKGTIPEEYRKPMGNRIFGCDDCQIFCPWNRYANHNKEKDFKPRHGLQNEELINLFQWSENEFDRKTAGSAIRRTGYQGWLRNIAVALGNTKSLPNLIQILLARKGYSQLLDEHINWALEQHTRISA